MNLNWLFAQDMTIIYVGDPMCSWCYGFAPEITAVKEHYPDAAFRIVMGGLRPQGTETMAKLGDFLGHHWQQVQEASGQPFTFDILKNRDFVYDTEPACRAVVAVREMNPALELAFFKDVQHLFYVDNLDPALVESYRKTVAAHGLSFDVFAELFQSPDIQRKTSEDFALANQMGIQGFPSVVLSYKGELHLVCRGYMKAQQLIAAMDKVMK